MTTVLLALVFLAYLGYREYEHGRHIRDLETKLLARNPSEYAQYKHNEEPPKQEAPRDKDEEEFLIDPFEVEPEEFLKGPIDG